MSFPNNRRATEKRLMYLKERFQRDLKFHEDYNKFMEEIISKGYAKGRQAGSSVHIQASQFICRICRIL